MRGRHRATFVPSVPRPFFQRCRDPAVVPTRSACLALRSVKGHPLKWCGSPGGRGREGKPTPPRQVRAALPGPARRSHRTARSWPAAQLACCGISQSRRRSLCPLRSCRLSPQAGAPAAASAHPAAGSHPRAAGAGGREGGRLAGWLAGGPHPAGIEAGGGGGVGGAWVCVCLSVRVVATAKRSGAVWGAGSLGAKLCNVVGRHSKSINPPPPRSYQQPPCQPQRTKTETKTPAAPRAVMFPRHQSAWGDSTLPSTGASLWGNSVKSWPSFRVRCRRGGWMCEQNLMVYTWKLQAACQLGKEEQVLSTAMPS